MQSFYVNEVLLKPVVSLNCILVLGGLFLVILHILIIFFLQNREGTNKLYDEENFYAYFICSLWFI